MTRQGRSQLVLGIILILLGAWFVATKTIPSLGEFADTYFQGPFILMWIGAGLLVLGLLTGNPGMAVPAAIVAGVGGIIWYNTTYAADGQSAWAYMWTLIPGFVGIGSIISGLLGDNPRQNISRGLNSMVVSATLFLIFAAIFGGLNILGKYGPAILLILLGLWLLGRSVWKSFRGGGADA
ncbi:MAG: hypothetical protein HFACDABA_01141 [Anaerolineales bacterium]|nr:hypothetical protein [Anaerolineales bacterium]